jgi:hypothetical protein
MENVKFITVGQFKTQMASETAKVLRNEKTGKLFLVTDNGDCFRVQADIDSSKEMKIMIVDNNFADCCLVNVSGGATEVFAL